MPSDTKPDTLEDATEAIFHLPIQTGGIVGNVLEADRIRQTLRPLLDTAVAEAVEESDARWLAALSQNSYISEATQKRVIRRALKPKEPADAESQYGSSDSRVDGPYPTDTKPDDTLDNHAGARAPSGSGDPESVPEVSSSTPSDDTLDRIAEGMADKILEDDAILAAIDAGSARDLIAAVLKDKLRGMVEAGNQMVVDLENLAYVKKTKPWRQALADAAGEVTTT